MSNLVELLDGASAAEPGERIEFRDRIAAHGAAAIPAMRAWLPDPRLGAFAVRVLQRIAEDASSRGAVLDAFASAQTGSLPDHVARDIAVALDGLGGARTGGLPGSRSAPRGHPEDWPGTRPASPIELRFHEAMLSIFTLAGEATRKLRSDGTVIRGYWASYFLRGVRNHGGPAYARQLLHQEGTSDGFQRLTAEHRLDLTVEALVLRSEFAQLFTVEERAIASSRLARAGYQP